MKKKLSLMLLCVFILMSISCVCASDNTTVTVNMDNSHMTIFNENSAVAVDVHSSSPNTNFKNAAPGTYDDLNKDIQNITSNSVYNITKDYKFGGKSQTFIGNILSKYLKPTISSGDSNHIITISQDNIIINGNGHTIDAGGSKDFAIFNITGNNVTINNLKFTNCRYEYNSPISWYGNDGVINGCIFRNGFSVNGGAITWMGNNGTISQCLFENNIAKGVGGAIYIGGTNNTISNCQFVRSQSQLSGEAIYVDRNRKNIYFVNDTFENSRPTIDGKSIGMDVNYFYKCHNVDVYGDFSTRTSCLIDIMPLIYKSIMTNGITKIDDILSYYADYNNVYKTFTLNIVAHQTSTLNIVPHQVTTPSRHDSKTFDYIKSFYFYNVININQIFDKAIHGNYKFDVAQVVTKYISKQEDYKSTLNTKSSGLWFNKDKDARKLTNGLRIIFTDKLSISSPTTTLNVKNMGFDIITIMGNGSTIIGGAGDRSEKKWIVIDQDNVTVVVNGLTIVNFNTAVKCLKGTCFLNNVKFNNNRMNYIADRDWGAAMLNTGVVICNNCSFTNNYAKNGGAIFNQGYLELNNCTFEENTAYGKGDNVCVGDGGVVMIDKVNITEDNNDDSIVYFAKSMSASTSTWMTIASIAGSFAIGFLAGVITANPLVGIAVGCAAGAAIGTFTAVEIISAKYDVNYDRLKTCLFVIGGSALAGAMGGFVGSVLVGEEAFIGQEIPYISRTSTFSNFVDLPFLIML